MNPVERYRPGTSNVIGATTTHGQGGDLGIQASGKFRRLGKRRVHDDISRTGRDDRSVDHRSHRVVDVIESEGDSNAGGAAPGSPDIARERRDRSGVVGQHGYRAGGADVGILRPDCLDMGVNGVLDGIDGERTPKGVAATGSGRTTDNHIDVPRLFRRAHRHVASGRFHRGSVNPSDHGIADVVDANRSVDRRTLAKRQAQ